MSPPVTAGFGYSEIRPGFTCEPESCIHDALPSRGRSGQCPDCGLSAYGRKRERELREQGWTVAEIADLGLMDE